MFTFSLLTLTQEAPMRRSRSRSPSLALALLLISALALTLLSGCQANRDQRDVVQPYEPRALKASLKALATQAHTLQALKGEARLHAQEELTNTLKRLLLTRDELISLFEPQRSSLPSVHQRPSPRTLALLKRYQETLTPAFLSEAPDVLATAIQGGLSEVVIRRVGPGRGEDNTPGDLKLLEAMPQRPPLYHARLLKPQEATLSSARGLRLNGFVFIGGRWATLLKLGVELESWGGQE